MTDTPNPSGIVDFFVHTHKQISEMVDLVFYVIAALGITLLLWPDVRETEELSLQGEPRATYRGTVRADRNLRPLIALMKPLSSLRVWSYMAIMVLAFLWMIFTSMTPLTPKGLKVCLPKPGTLSAWNEPWNEPLVVRIDARGNCYLNRQPVRLPDLGNALQNVLILRADRTVFLDADPTVGAGYVLEGADISFAAGGTRVILVTPSMKKEVPALAMRPPCEIQPLQERELRLPPKWRGHWYPSYPLVAFDVNERGEVSNVRIKKRGEVPGLDKWVVDSVRRWKFTPTPGCGRPVLEMYAPIYPY